MTDTDLDFLNEPVAGSAIQNSTNDDDTTGPDTAVSTEPASATDNPTTSTSRYTNIVATYGEGDPNIPAGLKSVTDFANDLTVRNITTRGQGAEGVVQAAGVYASMRATKTPLPVVMVGTTAFLPVEAVEVWDAKPVRGEGSGSTSAGGKLEDDDLLRLSGVAKDKVADLEKRLARTQERLEVAKKLLDKRNKQLSVRFGDNGWSQVEEYQAAHETVIPDDGDEQTDAKSE